MADQSLGDKNFDAYYFAHGCGRPYQRDEVWLNSFRKIADRIVKDIRPNSVLDAGCAYGFLVEALRQQGVEAYGIDISTHAIQNVHPDIHEYCWVGSVADPLPRKYDLIVSIEVLEHLSQGEAERALDNICQYTDDILFSSTPFDYKEVTHFNVQPPEYWSALFAKNGFFRDVDFDASFITQWAMRLRRRPEPIHRIVRDYERKFWLLWKENTDLRDLTQEMRDQLAENEHQINNLQELYNDLQELYQDMRDQISENEQIRRNLAESERRVEEILESRSWRIIKRFQNIRLKIIPKDSGRERFLFSTIRAARLLKQGGIRAILQRVNQKVIRGTKIAVLRIRHRRRLGTQKMEVNSIHPSMKLQPHQASVDIIVCVHNALEDIQGCLESIVRYTTPPYRLILVDDGSDAPTQDYLANFAESQGETLLRSEEATGYTLAANRGLRHSTADYAILLNSDTIVTPQWLDRMVACAESDEQIGVVGPLSNTASWQSIPEIFSGSGDWADNPLPEGIDIIEMGRHVSRYSARLYPRLPFLNGFCLLIKRSLLGQVGYFDEQAFGGGYGEENDYCLRARQAGWQLAVADDVYIYHGQSRSYSHELRKERVKVSDKALVSKHGQQVISDGVSVCRFDRVLQGVRARAQVMLEREKIVHDGLKQWEAKRVLFVLPITGAGGGAHVILQEAKAMQKMGVDVRIANLKHNQELFEQAYPDTNIPVIYFEETCIPVSVSREFDAVVSTIYHSLHWLDLKENYPKKPVIAYYIQDYEPDFFPPESLEYAQAKASYTQYLGLVRITKTEWNRNILNERIGVDSIVVGPSVDIDLFQPRRRKESAWPDRPLRIGAMIRPSTPRRQPGLTIEVLRDIYKRHLGEIEIVLFGCEPSDPGFFELSISFPWSHAGVLTRPRLANLFNEIDIFVDFSKFQAMGLTALEAMACGVGVIVPQNGGAESFAGHESNALIVDTSSKDACLMGLERLVRDGQLRNRLQQQAIFDACKFTPEFAASNVLNALFP